MSTAGMQVTIADRAVPILSAGADPEIPYLDSIVLSLGSDLAGLGETDLLLTVGGLVGNAVRINIQ